MLFCQLLGIKFILCYLTIVKTTKIMYTNQIVQEMSPFW